jgi:C4-dicarboxylate transporter DctM subunit
MVIDWYTATILFFGMLFALLMIGIPVAFGLLSTSMISLVIIGGGVKYLFDVPGYFFHHLNSFTLTCFPLFILMAMYVERAGFGGDLFKTMRILLRRLPGSLNVVGIASCAVFAAISGTSVGTAAGMGLVAIPEYKKYGYDPTLSVGSLAAGGALGILIPPSLAMIMYCVVTEQSIGHMFAGGILPGIMTALIFIIYVIVRCVLNPKLAPKVPREEALDITLLRGLLNLVPIILLIMSVLLTIYLGIATPTEAAALGCFGGMILGLIYRRLTARDILNATFDGTKTIAFIILLLMGGFTFGHAVVRAGIPAGMSELIVGLGLSKYAVLAIIMFILIVLGCFMEPTPIIITTMPIFFPIITAINFNPIFFGVLTAMAMQTSAITPPVGFNLFVLRGIGAEYVTMTQIIKGSTPFVALFVLTIVLTILFPDIIMFLPNRM